MTDDDYDAELIRQDFRCPLCLESIGTWPDTDHDHETNVFRGILDHRCNMKLHHDADMEWHRRAAAYLERAYRGESHDRANAFVAG